MYKIGRTITCWLVIVACIRVYCRSPNFEYKKYSPRNELSQESTSRRDSSKGPRFTKTEKLRYGIDSRREKDSLTGHSETYQNIKKNLMERLDPETSGLAIAYLLGDKNELNNITKERFKEIGISHLIAISGMHLSVMVGILIKILRFSSKSLRTYLCIVFILSYVGMIGLTPSLLRATIVIFCHLFAAYFGRRVLPSRVLIIAVALSLIIEPDNVLNIGWQLSMMAYTGILLYYPLIESFLFGKGNSKRSVGKNKKSGRLRRTSNRRKNDKNFDLRSGILMAVSVNLLTIPITLYVFGYFSLLSIFATLILSPMLPIILVSIMIVGLSPPIIYQFGGFLAAGGIELIKAQLKIIKILSDWQYFSIYLPKGRIEYFLLYIPVICLYFFLRRKNVEITEKNTGEQEQSIEGRNEMQKIGAYLVEWQKQLQLRYENQKNHGSVGETSNNMKNGG